MINMPKHFYSTMAKSIASYIFDLIITALDAEYAEAKTPSEKEALRARVTVLRNVLRERKVNAGALLAAIAKHIQENRA